MAGWGNPLVELRWREHASGWTRATVGDDAYLVVPTVGDGRVVSAVAEFDGGVDEATATISAHTGEGAVDACQRDCLAHARSQEPPERLVWDESGPKGRARQASTQWLPGWGRVTVAGSGRTATAMLRSAGSGVSLASPGAHQSLDVGDAAGFDAVVAAVEVWWAHARTPAGVAAELIRRAERAEHDARLARLTAEGLETKAAQRRHDAAILTGGAR